MLSPMEILEVSTALPSNQYSTAELIDAFPCRIPLGVKQNIFNIGVSSRYLISHSRTSKKLEAILSEDALINLCVEACSKTLENYDLSPKDVGYFVATYDANPFLCPGLSQLLIRRLGFSPHMKYINIQGMACTAFTKALEFAEKHIEVHPEDPVLLCISGVNSYWFYNQVQGLKNIMEVSEINSIKNLERRSVELRKWIAAMEFFLFGDGVASILVAKDGNGLSVSGICEVTNINEDDYLAGYARLTTLEAPFNFGLYTYLDKRIPELGVQYVSSILEKLEDVNGENPLAAAEKLAIHTGSEKILHLIAERHKIQFKKIEESFEVLRELGNLAGASLPFILEKIVSGNKLVRDDILFILGYGWGFSASACSLKFNR